MAAETHQNRRVTVWPGAVVNLLPLHRNVLSNDERANMFWKPLFNQVILNIEKASDAPIDRRVSETPNLAPDPIVLVHIADLALPHAKSDVGDKTPPSSRARSTRQLPLISPALVVPVQFVSVRPGAPSILPLVPQNDDASVSLRILVAYSQCVILRTEHRPFLKVFRLTSRCRQWSR